VLVVESLNPHLRQNFELGGLLKPQEGHADPSFAPHSLQNEASDRFSLWHLEQSTRWLPRQLVEQSLGVLQVCCVEPLGEPVVDLGEHRTCLVAAIRATQQAGETCGRS